jgi:hypothetical protein
MSNRLYSLVLKVALALAVTVAAAGCDNERSTCDRVCDWHVQCYGQCDYLEDPECDQEILSNVTRENCLSFCEGPEVIDEDLENAAVLYANCLDRFECAGSMSADCEIAEMRYYELYGSMPGEWVCGYFCGALDTGCIPWEKFGYRGNDCLDVCKQGARVPACREAHYAYDKCSPGSRSACEIDVGECVSQEDALIDACEAWTPANHIPEDESFCVQMSWHACDCGLRIEVEGCYELAHNQCRYQLGKGTECVDAITGFDACLGGIEECSREVLRDTCEPIWNDWVSQCLF